MNDDAPRPARTLLLWGDTQVGKTSLLASAFYGHPLRIQAVDRSASADAFNMLLSQTWRDLSQGRPVRQTSQAAIDLPLRCADGSDLRIRDIRGGTTRELATNVEARGWLREADGFAFLMEWRAAEAATQRIAILEALDFCGARPVALLLTKVEQHLPVEDAAWERPSGWWRKDPWGRANADLLARFGDSVWPTSCFGYHPEQGTPALVLGEYGMLLPYRVQPRGVCEPIEWLLAHMGIRA